MASRVLALPLALCVPCAALAAPVPPPRLVTAEAVLKPPRGNLRELAAKLVSAPFLTGVAGSRAGTFDALELPELSWADWDARYDDPLYDDAFSLWAV